MKIKRLFSLLFAFNIVGLIQAHIIILSNNDTHIDKAAAFGPRLTKRGILGNMFRPPEHSNEGCIPLKEENKPAIKDWIAIVERGGCSFVEKVRSLQASGAKAVIIGDKHYNGWITMYATGDASDIQIPSVYVAQYQFLSLLQHLTDVNEYGDTPVFIRITENELFSWTYSDLFLFCAVLIPSSILYAIYLAWRVRQDSEAQQHLQQQQNGEQWTVKNVFSKLPVHSFHREKDIPIDECIICLEEYSEGEIIRTLPCKHLFHSTCIQAWLNRKHFCPICKYDVCNNRYQQANERTPLLSLV
ncbi:unnamed protein product [Mucor hiemalis]